VVNLDLPWNPAVLEQRIGRVHRMGQRRGVQVINLVAQGSIEEGMLGVLAFKKSLFAGVLDGGDSTVFMNGTRLSKFMESVDEVTGAMGVAEEAPAAPVADAHALTAPGEELTPPADASAQDDTTLPLPQAQPEAPATPRPAAEPTTPAQANAPWLPLLHAGLQWIESLAAPPATEGGAGQASGPRISTDPATGQRQLTLPIPDPATVQRLAEGLAGLLARLKP
jgi:hypothetical protein